MSCGARSGSRTEQKIRGRGEKVESRGLGQEVFVVRSVEVALVLEVIVELAVVEEVVWY